MVPLPLAVVTSGEAGPYNVASFANVDTCRVAELARISQMVGPAAVAQSFLVTRVLYLSLRLAVAALGMPTFARGSLLNTISLRVV